MRRIRDARDRAWDVVVGRESYGTRVALFIPTAGNPEGDRQAILEAESQLDAEAELDALSEPELRALLERSEPKRLA